MGSKANKQRQAKKPRNKKHRPRQANPLAAAQVIQAGRAAQAIRAVGQHQLTHDAKVQIAVAFSSSLQMMKDGRGEEGDCATLTFAVNIAYVMCTMGFGAEFIDDISSAMNAIFRCRVRGDNQGIWTLDLDAVRALDQALNVCEAQLEIVTAEEVTKAIDTVYERIENDIVFKMAA
jgi:hypothetical protein